jgi:hypothetical protein
VTHGHGFGVFTDPAPLRLRREPTTQAIGAAVMMGLGQDSVTHLNQPGQIGTRAEAGINADYHRNRIGISHIVRFQVGQPLIQGRIYDLGEGVEAGKKESKSTFTQANRK